MTASSRVARFAMAIALMAVSCAPEKNPRPETIGGDAPENLRTCAELAGGATVSNGRIDLDGGVAACPAMGQACPLEHLESACAPREAAFARCIRGLWQLACERLDAGGRADAGPADGTAPD